MNKLSLVSLVAALALPVSATVFQFDVPLSGANEVGGGDPDGSGFATLWIDDSGPTPTVTWNISVNNIAAVTGDHIHNAPAGVNGPVLVNFSGALTGGPLADSDLTTLLADPTQWYVNVHTGEFPGGAIRGQLTSPVPEPEEYAAMFAAGVLLLASRPIRRRLFGA